ncbi:MAG: hypothetical protein N2644_05855 [Candidatus Sumerlaea chitinivorans]|nr:hypothetical protein [Candidatus Sumerlaea chitinivorans]
MERRRRISLKLTQHRSRAITLLELIVVAAIVSAGFLAFLTIGERALMGTRVSQERLRLNVLAQNELEWWKVASPERLATLTEGEHPFANPTAASLASNEQTVLRVRRREHGMLELSATASCMFGAFSHRPLRVTMTTLLHQGRQP